MNPLILFETIQMLKIEINISIARFEIMQFDEQSI